MSRLSNRRHDSPADIWIKVMIVDGSFADLEKLIVTWTRGIMVMFIHHIAGTGQGDLACERAICSSPVQFSFPPPTHVLSPDCAGMRGQRSYDHGMQVHEYSPSPPYTHATCYIFMCDRLRICYFSTSGLVVKAKSRMGLVYLSLWQWVPLIES